MIKVYFAGISSLYEGEDIEIRYCIFEDQTQLEKEFIITKYTKPSLVGAVALLRVLKALSKQTQAEILIYTNETALCEFVKGAGNTKNRELQKKVWEIQDEIAKFDNVTLRDISSEHKLLQEWNQILQA